MRQCCFASLLLPITLCASCGSESTPSESGGGSGGSVEAGTGGTGGSGGAGGSAGSAGAGATGGTGGTSSGGGAGAGGAPQPHEYSCEAVGTAPTDGIFTLRAFKGVMYAGLFGYGHEAESMLFQYPPWQRVNPGLLDIAESVCAMIEFQGMLYANTESDGHIFRSADGATWQRVYEGVGSQIGCGLEVFNGAIYAVNYENQAQNHGRVLRSTNGQDWSTVYDSGGDDLYLRHIVAHAGSIYAFATRENASEGKMLSSANGADWTLVDAPTRFFRALSWNGELYLSSTTSRSNGPAGIWQFSSGSPQLIHPVTTTYVTELAAWDKSLWAGTSDGWKDATGSSSLLMSRDGQSWETVCTFPEAAAWSVAALTDHLYVGTWEYDSYGKLYEVSIKVSGSPAP